MIKSLPKLTSTPGKKVCWGKKEWKGRLSLTLVKCQIFEQFTKQIVASQLSLRNNNERKCEEFIWS